MGDRGLTHLSEPAANAHSYEGDEATTFRELARLGAAVLQREGRALQCATGPKLTNAPARPGSNRARQPPLFTVSADPGVQMHELHLAVRLRLLEDLLEMAARSIVRDVQLLGSVGERISADDHHANTRLCRT